MKNDNNYVPENYFSQKKARLKNIPEQHPLSEKDSYGMRPWYWKVAAAVVIALGIGFWAITADSSENSQREAIKMYVLYNWSEFEDITYQSLSEGRSDTLSPSIPERQIIQYLENQNLSDEYYYEDI